MPSVMMMTSTVSEESIARDTHTDPHTARQTLASGILNFFKVVSQLCRQVQKYLIFNAQSIVQTSTEVIDL